MAYENIMTKQLTAGLLAIALLAMAGPGRAEMYKWVDDKGVTHYGDNPDQVGKAAAAQFKPNVTPAPAAPTGLTWQEREAEYRQQQMLKKPEPVMARPAPSPANPKRSYNSNQIATDASRCELARDVLSGAARHTNGAQTDKHDRDVAQGDVRNFCH